MHVDVPPPFDDIFLDVIRLFEHFHL